MRDCAICNKPKITTKAYEKLDSLADDNDQIVCKDCYKTTILEAAVVDKARTNDAFLVEIHWL